MADGGGLAKFQQRMQAIPKAARAAVQPALVKQGQALVQTMRQLAPDDPATAAPDLKSSIVFTRAGNQTPPYSQPGGSMTVPENAVVVTAGNTDVRYPHLVEYGHSNGFLKGGAKGTRGGVVPPKPFFWPAFRLRRKKAAAAIKRAIGKAIREAR